MREKGRTYQNMDLRGFFNDFCLIGKEKTTKTNRTPSNKNAFIRQDNLGLE